MVERRLLEQHIPQLSSGGWRRAGSVLINIPISFCVIEPVSNMILSCLRSVCTIPLWWIRARPRKVCKRIRLASGKGKHFLPTTSNWRDLTSPPITSVTRHRWSPSRSLPGCIKLARSRGQWFGSMPGGGGTEATRSKASSSHVIPLVARPVEYPFKALIATYLSSLWRSRV